jgi:hypothetical protein
MVRFKIKKKYESSNTIILFLKIREIAKHAFVISKKNIELHNFMVLQIYFIILMNIHIDKSLNRER